MRLVLDTSILIELERKNKEIENKVNELRSIYPLPPQISFMTYFEFLEGIERKSKKNKKNSKHFLALFEVLHTTLLTAQYLVFLRQKYEFPIPDLFIAAQTLESGGILVTKDADFKQIDEIDTIFM